MKKSFSARRMVRKVGQDDDEGAHDEQSQEPTVKRPSVQSKSKRKSGARLSFGPGGPASAESSEDGDSAVFTPKKSSLSRLAMERNAERKASELRAGLDADRPSYSKDHLLELQKSTPSTPKEIASLQTSEDEGLEKALDVAGKFGHLAKLGSGSLGGSAIPTDAEIREKKERRARLAQEQEYISLHGNESDEEETHRELLLRPKEKYAETRLVPDDEDIAEGFDDFVEDGKISLGRKAEREEQRQRREEIASRIAAAEGADSDAESDDSEADRNAAYDAAQTKAGTYGQQSRKGDEIRRPRTPPKITPIPELSTVLQQLRSTLQSMEDGRALKQKTLDDLTAEKTDIDEREAWIQLQLKETGERFEKLRAESGMAGTAYGVDSVNQGDRLVVHRGLDNFGSTPKRVSSEDSGSQSDSE